MSNNYNIPLWLGETGENSNHWYYEIVKLCENNNIRRIGGLIKRLKKLPVHFLQLLVQHIKIY